MWHSLVILPALSLGLLLLAIPFFFVRRGQLLHPFRYAQMHDPEMPRSLRWALALISLTAVAPLGGLAVPFWVWARRGLSIPGSRLWLEPKGPQPQSLSLDLVSTATYRVSLGR